MYRIVLFVDSKWRDLPGSVAIKYYLHQLGDFDVKVVSYHLWDKVLSEYNPHVVVLNHVQGYRSKKIASQIRRNGGAAIVQFNEGIIEFDGKARIFAEQKGHSDIEEFLCWNEETAELVGGTPIGCPRFDVYGDFKFIINERELFCDKYDLDYERPIILWNDSWPSAKFSYMLQDFHRGNWEDLKNTLVDKWEDPDEFAQSQYEKQNHFKRCIEEAQYNFPEIQMVLKSHPMSDFEMWDKWGEQHSVPVVHGEYIFNAINAADLVVTKLGSITVAESWLLDKTAIKLGTDYFSASSKEQHSADPWNAENMHTLMSGIDFAINFDQGNFSNSRNKYLRKWGLSPQGAAEKTALIIHEMLEHKMLALPPVDLRIFESSITAYDREVSANKLDMYGNWDKAITQNDVKQMLLELENGLK